MSSRSLRFLADEGFDNRIVTTLREFGYDVLCVHEGARRSTDIEVLALAAEQNRIILTDDKDFGELVVRFGTANTGVVLMRLPFDLGLRTRRLLELIETDADRLMRTYVVLGRNSTRFRSLRP